MCLNDLFLRTPLKTSMEHICNAAVNIFGITLSYKLKQREMWVETSAANRADEARRQLQLEAARRKSEEEKEKVQRAAEAAEEGRRAADERWRQGVPPEFSPSQEEVDKMRARYGYVPGHRHIAIVGLSGAGKSSLINAFCGLANKDNHAAGTGVTETTANVTRYPDPKHSQCAWYDVPGAGTLRVSDWQYFKDQGLYTFDAIIVLYADRFTKTDITILRTCRDCAIPTFIVRSKSDQFIRNMRRDSGYETDPDDHSTRFSTPFIQAEEKARNKFVNETTRDLKKNLEAASLRPQRVYLVSRSILMKVVKGESTRHAIDEHDLYGDISDIVQV